MEMWKHVKDFSPINDKEKLQLDAKNLNYKIISDIVVFFEYQEQKLE